jgi:small multidrug resistance pump|tara:strand:- start:671 stop:1084 length:414 start_codon:yes stop_codon:yes gene_type:complete
MERVIIDLDLKSVRLYFQIAGSSALAMNKWIYLTLAIFSEVLATASLKSTEGFTKLWPSVLVLVGYSAAFYFLSMTLDSIPIGVAYAIWSGVGVAAITLVSIFFLDQKIDTAGFIGIGLIVAGVIVLRLFSESAVEA